jgi:class 3 adenylate cyclase
VDEDVTEPREELALESRFVVVFDICSSSNILEELIVRQNLAPMRNLLIDLKKFLQKRAEKVGFETYKFIGDGWIVLFPLSTTGSTLVTFLEDLSRYFRRRLRSAVIPHLERSPSIVGLTFGVDAGPLIRLQMMGKIEYIGRPINIASRLQGAIKDKDDNPAYKVLFSKPAFNQLKLDADFRDIRAATRTLRNIRSGEKYPCVKMVLEV